LREYRDVPLTLKDKGKIDHLQLKSLIAAIAAFVTAAEIIYPRKKISICRDAEDNILLECCFEANADFLITGDRDLLDLKDLPFHLKILTPREFIEERYKNRL
jgi:putative PIN family toxin of toxin-antitoxin system